MTVAILVPVLGRPQNVKPLLTSIHAATPAGQYRVLFIADPDDHPEQDEIRRCRADILITQGGWAAKINAAASETTEPLLFLAADDLRFKTGWLQAATAKLTGDVQVVGVNDLIERRPDRVGHATHFLITRGYAEQPCIDGSPGPLFTGYDHSFVDDELIATATRRGVYAYAPDAHVEHRHPMNGTAPDDEIYRRGRARFRLDRKLHARRARLWT